MLRKRCMKVVNNRIRNHCLCSCLANKQDKGLAALIKLTTK